MARPREFSEEAVLERATRVFWSKGYEHASLDDLCAATDLGRSSLYAAFGDKRALYLRTLARYEAGSLARINAALAGKPIRDGIAALLQGLIDSIVAGPGRHGCFIGNCAAELSRLDPAAAARVRRSLERIEAAFRDALVAAKAKGEIGKTADPAALARFLTASIQGLRLVGKAKPERATLDDIARTVLYCLKEK